jgi:hypothetical protein
MFPVNKQSCCVFLKSCCVFLKIGPQDARARARRRRSEQEQAAEECSLKMLSTRHTGTQRH